MRLCTFALVTREPLTVHKRSTLPSRPWAAGGLAQPAANTISVHMTLRTVVYLQFGHAVTMSPVVGLVAMAVTGPS